MIGEPWFWIFNLIVVVLLFIDLLGFHHKKHVVKVKEALLVSAFWIALALLFNLFVYQTRGSEAALNFLTGYVVEKSLSVDNLFVFLLIFSYFKVPAKLQHTVLFWGIFAAIIMRALFIFAGIALVQNFHWIIYFFGAFLIYTGIKLALEKDQEIHPEANPLINFFRKWFPVTKDYVGHKFIVQQEGRYFLTPLFLVLVMVEITDVIFAFDSIPAIIGITEEPFIVYTSNILAILGLRSLYFVVAHVITLFHYLHYGLAFILVFIGVKMLISGFVSIPILLSLAIIALVISLSIFASLLFPAKK